MSGPSSSSSLATGEEGVVDDSPINSHDPNRWFFEKTRVENSPSRKAGVDADKELAYRQQAANFIQDIGQRLQVNQLCINTAIVYMHRFYMYHSFTHFHRNAVSTASIFLAAKVEEQPRKLDHVIKVSHYCLHRDLPAIDPNSEAYRDQSAELVMNENILLQTLGFDVAIDHPHTHVVKCCQLVRASKDLAQTSYFMATNSLHLTTMCLQYRPTLVACVCIHLACKWSSWEIPRSKEGKDWWKYVDENCTAEQLEAMTSEFLLIFNKSPSRLKRKIISLNASGGPEGGKLLNVPALAGLTLPDTGAPHAQPRSHSRSPSPKRQRVGNKPGEMVLKAGMKPPGHPQGPPKGPPPPHGSMKPPPVKGPPPPSHGVPPKDGQHRQQPPPYGRPGSGPQAKGPPPSYPGKPPSSKPHAPPPPNARAYPTGMMAAPQVAAAAVPPNKLTPSEPNRLAPPKDLFKFQQQQPPPPPVGGSGRSAAMAAPSRPPHAAPNNNVIHPPKPQDNRGGANHTKTDASKYAGTKPPPPPSSHPLPPPKTSGAPPPSSSSFYKQPSLLPPPPPGGRPHSLQMPPDMKKSTGAPPPRPPQPQQPPPPPPPSSHQQQQQPLLMAPPQPTSTKPAPPDLLTSVSTLSVSNGEAGGRASLFSPEASSQSSVEEPKGEKGGSGDEGGRHKAKKEKKKHKHKEKGREEKKHHKKDKHKKKKREDASPPHENLKIKLTLNKEGYSHQVTAAPSSSKQKQRPS